MAKRRSFEPGEPVRTFHELELVLKRYGFVYWRGAARARCYKNDMLWQPLRLVKCYLKHLSLLSPKPRNRRSRTFHVSQSIRGAFHIWTQQEWSNNAQYFRLADGTACKDAHDLKELFMDLLSAGHELIGSEGCDNFDPAHGCLGHDKREAPCRWIKVQYYDWNASYAYAPPCKDAIINTDHIISAVESKSGRVSGPLVKITFIDGRSMDCRGEPEEIWKAAQDTGKIHQ